MCTVLTEVNTNLNLYKFEIGLNKRLNLGSSGLYIGYLSIGERNGVSVYKLASKWMIYIDVSYSAHDVTM